jgi:LysR family transcriptional regulator, glycine cleavage system transcriptional activator
LSRQRVPPLSWLKVFEAAARHGNFAAAARELSLSRGAISRTIKELEQFVRVALFVRNAHGVQLTEAGLDYADAIRPAIGALARASVEVRLRASHETCNRHMFSV